VQAKQPSEHHKESAGPQRQQVASQASGQTVEAKIVNSNVIDMFVAFIMVQQIMTGLSVAASEGEKRSVITKAVSSLLKFNGSSSS
jgi:hypothetical protein